MDRDRLQGAFYKTKGTLKRVAADPVDNPELDNMQAEPQQEEAVLREGDELRTPIDGR